MFATIETDQPSDLLHNIPSKKFAANNIIFFVQMCCKGLCKKRHPPAKIIFPITVGEQKRNQLS